MKILKLFISLSLILSVSLINSIAAISVSDGSAFVTKAEFAADLNNLSNRMSSLENSLDAKIDSLVSSYLSRNGIWNGEKQTAVSDHIYQEIKSSDIWISSSLRSSFQYIYSPIEIFGKLTKSGLFVFNSEWGMGSYFKETSNKITDNDGAVRIKKYGTASVEFFGMDIQIGELQEGKTANNDNFIIKNSFSLGSQFRGSSSSYSDNNFFSIGAQVHYGACSFFVTKNNRIFYRVLAYGQKSIESIKWPESVYGTPIVGFKNFDAYIY